MAARALRSAGLMDDVRMEDGETAGQTRAQRRKMARAAAEPGGRRGTVNINGPRPANQRRHAKLGAHALSDRGASADVAPQTNVVATLRRFLESRWDPHAQLLNLSHMQQDPLLAEAQIRPPGAPGAHKDLGTALWKLSGDMFPTLTTLSLEGNALKTLAPLATLGQYVPALANLSLENNELRMVRDLDGLASRKAGLPSLQELILVGNPLQQNALESGNEDGYRRDVLAKFGQLRILDRKPVTDVEHGFAQLFKGRHARQRGAEAAQVPLRSFPLNIASGFVDGDAAAVAPEFLSHFFAAYDQGRAQLRAVYSANARFSYCINSSPPPRARAERLVHTMPHQKSLTFDKYMELGARNVLRTHNTKALLRSLHHGTDAIVAFLQRLPATTHPLHDASKFVVDAWLLPNVDVKAQTSATDKPEALLFITVHGEFTEAPSQGVRSFDRTFVVAPAAPGSDAAQHGWPCVVVSDELMIRHYSREAAFAPGSLAVGGAPPAATPPGTAPAAPPTSATPAPAPMPGVAPEQHALALQLSAQTKLTYPFAVQCLQENGWDMARALAVFSSLQAAGSIPAAAFVSM